MSAEEKPKRTKKTAPIFGIEEARTLILTKLQAAGTKGAPSFFTAKTAAAKRQPLESALSALESEGTIFVDRRKAKPKFFAAEFKPPLPDRESVAARISRYAAIHYPLLLTETELKRSVSAADEKPLFPHAFDALKKDGRLLELRTKTKIFYIDAGGLKGALSIPAASAETAAPHAAVAPASPASLDARITSAYREICQNTRFPDIAISALQQASGVPFDELKAWIRAKIPEGKADLSLGDWSLADDTKRAGAIEMAGERYLLVRLHP